MDCSDDSMQMCLTIGKWKLLLEALQFQGSRPWHGLFPPPGIFPFSPPFFHLEKSFRAGPREGLLFRTPADLGVLHIVLCSGYLRKQPARSKPSVLPSNLTPPARGVGTVSPFCR